MTAGLSLLVPGAEWLSPVHLSGQFVSLEPLGHQHAADLSAGADAQTIAFLARGGPTGNTPAEWARYIDALNTLPERLNWAVLRGGVAVGRISYSEVKVADRWVEIGTMLLPAAQGTQVNPEAKLLLMTRAFEVLGAGRVQFKVDARNLRSRAAMRKLGATEEGILRRYQVRSDGVTRDSVMFSVLPEEWPAVKAGLQHRLSVKQ